jgi:hypothetical protein
MKKRKPFVRDQIYDPVFLKNGERHKGAKKNGWLKHWKEEKVFKFTWEYCGHCQGMFVRCPMCGNNCCNSGSGKVKSLYEPTWMNDPKGKHCPVCNLAYQYQDLSYQTKTAPKPTAKQIKEGKREEKKAEKYMNDIFS